MYERSEKHMSVTTTEAAPVAELVINPNPLSGWEIRATVSSVVAYWKSPTHVIHDEGSKCAARLSGPVTSKDRKWLEAEFTKRAKAEDEGVARTVDFCTRCVTKRPGSPTVAPRAAARQTSMEADTLELVKTPEQQAAWDALSAENEADLNAVLAAVDAEPVAATTKRGRKPRGRIQRGRIENA